METKISKLTEQIVEQIVNGEYGRAGEEFISTRQLAEIYDISIDSACKVMSGLREQRVITLQGKHSYLTTGYVSPRTPYGKRLAETRKKILGIAVNRIDNPFFSSLISALSNAVSEQGYTLLIANCNHDVSCEAKCLEEFLALGASGVFICPSLGTIATDLYKRYPLPLVGLGRELLLPNVDSVHVNNYAAGKQVADYLKKIDCHRYAYLGVKRNIGTDPRLEGFKDQLSKYGVEPKTISLLSVDDVKIENANLDSFSTELYQLLRHLEPNKRLGVFCYHDLLAAKLLQTVRRYNQTNERKFRVPEDIAIVGFDDLPLASMITPSLTTIAYHYGAVAKIAVDAMMDYILNAKHQPRTHEIFSYLTVRGSSDARSKAKE